MLNYFFQPNATVGVILVKLMQLSILFTAVELIFIKLMHLSNLFSKDAIVKLIFRIKAAVERIPSVVELIF